MRQCSDLLLRQSPNHRVAADHHHRDSRPHQEQVALAPCQDSQAQHLQRDVVGMTTTPRIATNLVCAFRQSTSLNHLQQFQTRTWCQRATDRRAEPHLGHMQIVPTQLLARCSRHLYPRVLVVLLQHTSTVRRAHRHPLLLLA